MPTIAPVTSLIVTVVFGSPLPVIDAPSSAKTKSLGASGGVVSFALTVAGAEVFPAASVNVTSSGSPFVNGLSRCAIKLPAASTTPVPTTVPDLSFTVTVVFGSPLPISFNPSLCTSRSVGASSAVVSCALTDAFGDSFSALSFRLTLSFSPFTNGLIRSTTKLPSIPTVPVPTIAPVTSLIVTVVFGSPLPVRINPSRVTSRSVGASGAVVSGAVTVTSGDLLPALSSS